MRASIFPWIVRQDRLASSFFCAPTCAAPQVQASRVHAGTLSTTKSVGQFLAKYRHQMKIKIIITIFFFIFLVSCEPVATVAPRSDNFSFIFQDFSCALIPVNVLDTKSGTLVHTPLGDTTSITISLHLTNDELELIYQKAISIGFFDYPTNFVIPDDQVLGYHSPASSYQLSMTNGELSSSVTWIDNTMTNPGYTKADQLRELMNLIDEIIKSHPEIQQLPEPKALCV